MFVLGIGIRVFKSGSNQFLLGTCHLDPKHLYPTKYSESFGSGLDRFCLDPSRFSSIIKICIKHM